MRGGNAKEAEDRAQVVDPGGVVGRLHRPRTRGPARRLQNRQQPDCPHSRLVHQCGARQVVHGPRLMGPGPCQTHPLLSPDSPRRCPQCLVNRAWAAGLFDGEGNIEVRTAKDNCTRFACRIAMGHEETVNQMKSIFGGTVHEDRHHGMDYMPMYKWGIFGFPAGAFLKSVYPFLCAKRAEADIAIECLDWRLKRKPYQRYTDRDRKLLLSWSQRLRDARTTTYGWLARGGGVSP